MRSRLAGLPSRSLRALALLLVAGLALSSAAASGCSTGAVKGSGDAKPSFDCTAAPSIFCSPLPGPGGCVGDPASADEFLRRLPANQAYPEGCTVNFVRRDPKLEDVCGLEEVCRCEPIPVLNDASPADTSRPDAEPADASSADASPDTAGPVDSGPPAPTRLGWVCR